MWIPAATSLPDPASPWSSAKSLSNHYPDLTFATLERWRDQYTNETVRWNLAMAVSASGGVAHVARSLAFLHTLAADDRRTVWRAVASAARALGKKRPDIMVPELRRWLDDPSRRQVSETALKHVTGGGARRV